MRHLVVGLSPASLSYIRYIVEHCPDDEIVWCGSSAEFGGDSVDEITIELMGREARRLRDKFVERAEKPLSTVIQQNWLRISSRFGALKERERAPFELLKTHGKVRFIIDPHAHFESPIRFKALEEMVEFDKAFLGVNTTHVIPGFFEGVRPHCFSIHDLFSSEHLPDSVIIYGSQYSAIRIAQICARFGVKVTLVSQDNSLLSLEDPAVGEQLETIFLKERITIVKEFAPGAATVSFSDGKCHLSHGGQAYSGEKILVVDQFLPKIGALNLEVADVGVDFAGKIIVDSSLKTTADGVFAAGLAVSQPGCYLQRVNLERRAAKIAAINSQSLLPSRHLNFNAHASLPVGLVITPEFARVGPTEMQARETFGADIVVERLSMDEVPIGVVDGYSKEKDFKGCYVTLVTKRVVDSSTGKESYIILGAQMFSPRAKTSIQTVIPFIGREVLDLFKQIFIYPTHNEALKLCAKKFPTVREYLTPPVSPVHEEILVVGAGITGIAAALRLGAAGKKVTIVDEEQEPGGFSTEALGTKLMLRALRRIRSFEARYDDAHRESFDSKWGRLRLKLAELVAKKRAEYREQLERNGNITFLGSKQARFLDPKTVRVTDKEGEAAGAAAVTQDIRFDKAIITTGRGMEVLPCYRSIYASNRDSCWTSTDALACAELPGSVTIIGGGVIAVEFAQMWLRLGVKVTIITPGDILGYAESSIRVAVKAALIAEGATIIDKANISHPRRDADGKYRIVKNTAVEAEEEIFLAEGTTHLFLATPRVQNGDPLNLGMLHEDFVDSCGRIKVSDFFQTRVFHIWAAGFCTTYSAVPDLASTAAEVGECVASNARHPTLQRGLIVGEVPSAVFIDPEFSTVGKNSVDLKNSIRTNALKKAGVVNREDPRLKNAEFMATIGEGVEIEFNERFVCRVLPIDPDHVLSASIDDLPHAPIYSQCHLVLVAEKIFDDEGKVSYKLVGASMLAPHAALAIQLLTDFVNRGKTVQDIFDLSLIQGDIADALRLCAAQFPGVEEMGDRLSLDAEEAEAEDKKDEEDEEDEEIKGKGKGKKKDPDHCVSRATFFGRKYDEPRTIVNADALKRGPGLGGL